MTTSRYDEIAEWYDKVVRTIWSPDSDPEVFPALLELIGNVAGKQVCDVGCGQGAFTRKLAQRGAKVTGVDISERMLDFAKRDEKAEPLGVAYLLDDAERLSKLPPRSFDGVVSNWALVDIDDLSACVKAVARILRRGGWFVFAITHPCFQSPDSRWVEGADGRMDRLVRNYFEEGFWRSENCQHLIHTPI